MNYTSIEQSKHLLEIGLSPDTADMCWFEGEPFIEKFGYEEERAKTHRDCGMEMLPSWTSDKLMELMGDIRLLHYEGKFFCQYFADDFWDEYPSYATAEYDNSIDACFDMFCWLTEYKKIHEQN